MCRVSSMLAGCWDYVLASHTRQGALEAEEGTRLPSQGCEPRNFGSSFPALLGPLRATSAPAAPAPLS